MASFTEQLHHHKPLSSRRVKSEGKLAAVRCEFAKYKESHQDDYNSAVTVFVAGSMARGEASDASDLDLFFLTTTPSDKRRHLQDIDILAAAININRSLGYEPFSNDGEFLKIHSLNHMLKALGAPQDDSENLFTTRMLLLLESRCVFNESIYKECINEVLGHYFRDNRGKSSFRPLFLLNDVLRYWRTLCLNYELARDDPSTPWRKKNINLKFSRMLTVFGTVLPLIATPVSDIQGVKELTKYSPHKRFSMGLDELSDPNLAKDYASFLDDYESFLRWKEQMGSEEVISNGDLDKESRAAFNRYADFLYRALNHDGIAPDLRRFLVL